MKKNKTIVRVRLFDVNNFIATGIIIGALCYGVLKQHETIENLKRELEAKGE